MELHIGNLLTHYFNTKRTRRASLARLMNVHIATILGYQKKESLQTKTLMAMATILKHNFFMDIAMQLPQDYTTTQNIFEEKNLEIATLKEQVNKLQIERDILLMAIGK